MRQFVAKKMFLECLSFRQNEIVLLFSRFCIVWGILSSISLEKQELHFGQVKRRIAK